MEATYVEKQDALKDIKLWEELLISAKAHLAALVKARKVAWPIDYKNEQEAAWLDARITEMNKAVQKLAEGLAHAQHRYNRLLEQR